VASGSPGSHLRIFFQKIILQLVVKLEIGSILPLDYIQKDVLGRRAQNLLRSHKITVQSDIPLRFFSVGTEPEMLDKLQGEAADAENIDVENSMFRHRGMPQPEDDGLVGLPCTIHFFPGRLA